MNTTNDQMIEACARAAHEVSLRECPSTACSLVATGGSGTCTEIEAALDLLHQSARLLKAARAFVEVHTRKTSLYAAIEDLHAAAWEAGGGIGKYPRR